LFLARFAGSAAGSSVFRHFFVPRPAAEPSSGVSNLSSLACQGYLLVSYKPLGIFGSFAGSRVFQTAPRVSARSFARLGPIPSDGSRAACFETAALAHCQSQQTGDCLGADYDETPPPLGRPERLSPGARARVDVPRAPGGEAQIALSGKFWVSGPI